MTSRWWTHWGGWRRERGRTVSAAAPEMKLRKPASTPALSVNPGWATQHKLWLFMITSTVQSPAFFTYCIPACYDLIRSHGKRAGFKATPYHSITIKVIFKALFSRDISIPRYSWCDRSVVCAVKFLHITAGFQGQSSQASGACRPRIPILTAQWLIPSWFTLKFDVWFLKGLRFVISL